MAEHKIVVGGQKESSSAPPVPVRNERPRMEREAEQDDIKEGRRERSNLSRSVSRRAEIKKETFGDRVKHACLGERSLVEAIEDYIIEGLIPGAKALFFDTIFGSFESYLFGQASGRRVGGRSSQEAGYNYAKRYKLDRERDSRDSRDRRRDVGYIWEMIEPMSRSEANSVLADMRDRADKDEYCTVGDLMFYLGFKERDISDEPGSESQCWYLDDLRSDRAGIREVRGGYLLDLPKPRSVPRYSRY